jgi:hypothetical protein
VLRREYSGFLATVVGFIFIDVLRYYFLGGEFEWDVPSLYILLTACVITLVLRSLKHYTNLLNEEGRS